MGLLYALRLSVFRLLCHLIYRESNSFGTIVHPGAKQSYRALKSTTIEKVISFFNHKVLSVPALQRKKVVSQNPFQTRIRINMTKAGAERLLIKSWQPTVSKYLIPSISKTMLELSENKGAILGLSVVSKKDEDGYYFKSIHGVSTLGCQSLSTYCWNSNKSVDTARLLSVRMLAPSVTLCGVFAMNQIWGEGKLYESQCKTLKSFLEDFKV